MSYHYLLQYCRKAEKKIYRKGKKEQWGKEKEKRKRKNKRDGLQGEVLVIRLLKKMGSHGPQALLVNHSAILWLHQPRRNFIKPNIFMPFRYQALGEPGTGARLQADQSGSQTVPCACFFSRPLPNVRT